MYMVITICEIDCQSRFNACNRVLRAGALGQPEGWDGEGGGRGVQDGEYMYTHDTCQCMAKTTTIL